MIFMLKLNHSVRFATCLRIVAPQSRVQQCGLGQKSAIKMTRTHQRSPTQAVVTERLQREKTWANSKALTTHCLFADNVSVVSVESSPLSTEVEESSEEEKMMKTPQSRKKKILRMTMKVAKKKQLMKKPLTLPKRNKSMTMTMKVAKAKRATRNLRDTQTDSSKKGIFLQLIPKIVRRLQINMNL